MTLETEPTPTPEPPAPEPPAPEPPGIRVEVLGAMDELRRDLVGRMVALEARSSAPAPHLLARYATFDEFATAAYDDPLLARALADQISSESPGVVPPSWASEVFGIGTFARPAVTATGGPGSLGDTGMEYDWPYVDPALPIDTVVAKQSAEKAQIASVKVKILKGSVPIDTYAGGSDVAYQLIRRSRPAYRDAYLRILAWAYNRATESAYEAALLAGAGSSAVLTATATADQVRAFLFAASTVVRNATGAPATVDLVSSAEFARLGGLTGLVPSAYGTNNVPGTAQA